MGRNVHIWDVDEQTHLKMRLLATGQGISMAKLLEKLIEKEWNEDKTVPDKPQKRRMKKIIGKWR